MAFPNPFVVPSAANSPYLANLAGVGGAYNTLRSGATPQLLDASGNLINAGQAAIGPGEFDPTVARLLGISQAPVQNDLEDYFFKKYMADANDRVAARGLIGQGAGEGLLNEAAKNYSFGRADTALNRMLAAGEGASALRTGQVGRAASLTGAGLSPYDTLTKLLTGQGNTYGNAAELNNQVGITNARNNAALIPTYFNVAGSALGALGKGVGGAYSALTSPMSDSQIAAVRDRGLTSDTGASSYPDSGQTQVTGGDTMFIARGGRIPGQGAYDHVKALLTPREYVIRRPVAMRAKSALDRLNAGDFGGAARRLAHVASTAR